MGSLSFPKADLALLPLVTNTISPTPAPAKSAATKVEHKEIVQVKVFGERSLIFDDVVIRVHPNYQTYMHIDFDEANSCGFQQGALGKIIKKNAEEASSNIEKADKPLESCHAPGNDTGFIEKRVITERDLQKLLMQKKKKVLIPQNSITTPLAMDYAKKHKLEIQRCEELLSGPKITTFSRFPLGPLIVILSLHAY